MSQFLLIPKDREALTISSTKDVSLSVCPNKVVWFVGVDIELILSCRSDPLARHGDESEQESLDPVSSLNTEEDGHEQQCHDVSVEVCSHGGDELEDDILAVEDLLCRASQIVVQYGFLVGCVPSLVSMQRYVYSPSRISSNSPFSLRCRCTTKR